MRALELSRPTSASTNLDFLRAVAVLLERLAPRGRYWRFLVKRAFRIYPASILTVLIVFVFAIPQTSVEFHAMHNPGLGWSGLASNLVLIQNLVGHPSSPGVVWSLPFEMQMYLALPLLFAASVHWWSSLLFWCAAVAVMPFTPVLAYAPCSIPGVMAYQRWRSNPILPAWTWPLALLAFIGAYAIWGTPGASIRSAVLCLLLGLALPLFAELKRPLLCKAANLIAKYSYGIYLTHLLAMWLGFMVLSNQHRTVRIAVFLVVAVVLPIALYHALEEPLTHLGARLAKPRDASPTLTPIAPRLSYTYRYNDSDQTSRYADHRTADQTELDKERTRRAGRD